MAQSDDARYDGNGPCRVVVLSPSPMVSEALARLLARFEGLAVSHAAIDDPLVLQDLGSGPPHIVLIEASSPKGVDAAAAHVRAVSPGSHVVLVARDPGPWCDRLCSSIGALGWVSSSVAERHLARALAFARVAGRLPDLVAQTPPSADTSIDSLLTGRELQVLRLLVAGQRPEEIAGRLDISSNTVRTHLQNILSRLGVHSRFEASTLARRAGLRGGPLAEVAAAGRARPG